MASQEANDRSQQRSVKGQDQYPCWGTVLPHAADREHATDDVGSYSS